MGKKLVDYLKRKEFGRFGELIGGIVPDNFLTKFLGPDAPKTYNKLLGHYLWLRDGRAWLRQIAKIGPLKQPLKYLLPHVSVHKNDRGQLIFNIPPLVRILEKVEAARVRICPICGLIFWAARLDQPCCTPRCAKVRRSRFGREKYQILYGPQIRKKRRSRKHGRERAALANLRTESSSRKRSARLPVKQKNDERTRGD